MKCFVIDGKTSGLKRKHGINDHIPHHVPITKQMDKLLSRLKALSDEKKYVFQPIMASRFDHLTPEAINDYLVRLGYKNKQRSFHGWRRTARTNFVDILGCDRDIIKRQMGHLPDNKVDQAYDQSLRLRRDIIIFKNGLTCLKKWIRGVGRWVTLTCLTDVAILQKKG